MNKLLIFPFNGNGLEAIDCIGDDYELIGFVDDTKEKQGMENGYNVFSRDAFDRYPEAKILAVPGSPATFIHRKKIIDGLGIREDRFARVIHPSARISKLSKIGYNVLLMAGVVVTSNGIIHNHICILPNTVVHHDVEIGSYSLIGSNITIAGYTKIGDNCYIGSGTKIINSITIGEKCLIGLGTNVIKSLPPNSKAVGNPGRIIGSVI